MRENTDTDEGLVFHDRFTFNHSSNIDKLELHNKILYESVMNVENVNEEIFFDI
jgi:hypothetical protein